jgi:hypothetical protein
MTRVTEDARPMVALDFRAPDGKIVGQAPRPAPGAYARLVWIELIARWAQTLTCTNEIFVHIANP